MERIGAYGEAGSGLSEGHRRGNESTAKELMTAIRAEFDALYAKLNSDTGTTDKNYGVNEKKFTV